MDSEAGVRTVKKPRPKTVKKPKLTLAEAAEAEQKQARSDSTPKKVFKSAVSVFYIQTIQMRKHISRRPRLRLPTKKRKERR